MKKMVLRLSAALRRRFAHALTDAYLDTQVWSGQVWRRREGGYDEKDGYVRGMRIPGPENQKAKRGWIQCAKFEVRRWGHGTGMSATRRKYNRKITQEQAQIDE